MPKHLTAPPHPFPFHHVPRHPQVEALIRASGYPSKSPGKERGMERQKEIRGKRQEVGEEESMERGWSENWGQGGVMELGALYCSSLLG